MAEVLTQDQMQALRDLLREGRVNEADRQLDELQRRMREEAERIKRETPPPTPATLAQLLGQFQITVCDLLGNPPKLTAIITEIQGKTEKAE